MEGELTFADAPELTENGTIRKKTLEDKIVDGVVPIETLFGCDDHGLYHQFEMGKWRKEQVASWSEIA